MDPTLTRSDAHKYFGELYRKERPPEVQRKIEDVVLNVSDIFARISQIEEIDAEWNARKKKNGSSKNKKSSRQYDSREPKAYSSPSYSVKSAASKKSNGKGKVGFFVRMFGGTIGIWGAETGTLDAGFLGLSFSISRQATDIFSELRETDIQSTIRCFRYVLEHGWEVLIPEKYNAIMIAYQFFQEFIQLDGIAKQSATAVDWINSTIKMQKFYATLLQYSDYQEILTSTFIDIASKNENLNSHIDGAKKTMAYVSMLDDAFPAFKNIIIAYYALYKKKIIPWSQIELDLRVAPPETMEYRANEAIKNIISAKIKTLEKNIRNKTDEIREIEDIRKKYFKIDKDNRIDISFINQVCEFVLRKIFPENTVNEGLEKTYRAQPHRLLFIALRDFELCAAPLLAGSIASRYGGSMEEVIVVKQGLLRPLCDEISSLSREVETYIKKNNNLNYTNEDYYNDLKSSSKNDHAEAITEYIKKAKNIFRRVLADVGTIMNNHENALQLERSTKMPEKMQRTKMVPIESFNQEARFLPHADRELIGNNRFTGMRIAEAFNEIMMDIYNYLYLFRDEELVSMLSSAEKEQTEIASMKEELRRLGKPV